MCFVYPHEKHNKMYRIMVEIKAMICRKNLFKMLKFNFAEQTVFSIVCLYIKSAKDVSMEETKWREITHWHGSLVHLVLGHAGWHDSFILPVYIKVNRRIASLPVKQEAAPIIRVTVRVKQFLWNKPTTRSDSRISILGGLSPHWGNGFKK